MRLWSTTGLILLVSLLVSTPVMAQGPGRPGPPPGGEEHFKRLDEDGDGHISEEEWLKHHAERFRKIDKNGDGLVTAWEMMAHHNARRRGSTSRRNDGPPEYGEGIPSER